MYTECILMQSRLRSIPIFLVVLIVLIAVVNFLANKYFWYWTFTFVFDHRIVRWFDMPMHFLGGVWLAGMALWWYSSLKLVIDDFLRILAIALLAAFGIGLIWEMYEGGVGLVTVGHINAMSDTLSDLSFDTLGGVVVALWTWFMRKKVN